ncbi:putative lipoprotein [Pandoraea sp. SD6-2]|nr:putative lipoprotein [Pandoraea sp. SD6-2]
MMTKSGIIAAFAMAALLTGCGDSEEKPKSASRPTEVPAPPTPPQPTHYYSIAQDGEYGYQPALSDDDRKAGTATKALLMVRYQGKTGKKYRVDLIDNGVTNKVSCESPCKFVKSETYLDGYKARTDTVAAAEGSLIWAILQDAMNGELEVYQKPKS